MTVAKSSPPPFLARSKASSDDLAGGDPCLRPSSMALVTKRSTHLEPAALGLGPGGHIVHELGIERPGLAAASLESAVGAEIGVNGDQLLLERDSPHQHQEEGLARTVPANDEGGWSNHPRLDPANPRPRR